MAGWVIEAIAIEHYVAENEQMLFRMLIPNKQKVKTIFMKIGSSFHLKSCLMKSFFAVCVIMFETFWSPTIEAS